MPGRPALSCYRYDTAASASITLAGEIDLDTAPLLRAALELRLHDGVSRVDVDLSAVSFCDASGLNVFLAVSRHAAAAGVSLRLREPDRALVRLFDLAGCGFLLAPGEAGLPVPALCGYCPAGLPSEPLLTPALAAAVG